ncbi:MAG TPA: peroxiredoxin [Acidimicrobiales bacterium]|jgi:peroxiredoxin Q/BCP|nr:peroxiredoxin [Acidimicrobiales bacterium]
MKPGDQAPEFELQDQTGATLRLSEMLANGPVVLFFYPAAMTTGCTKESCHFRDLSAEFGAYGAQRVGISRDDVAKQKQFDDKHTLGFPLLADTDRAVAEAYGVKGGMLGLSPVKRATFVIDRDRTVKAVITSEINMNTHADKALAALKELQPSS